MYPMLETIDHRPSDLIFPMPLKMLCYSKYIKRIAAAYNEPLQWIHLLQIDINLRVLEYLQ